MFVRSSLTHVLFSSFQQGYGQQNYGSYAQPAAADGTYTQTTPATGGYPQQQQQYGSSYGQPASGQSIRWGACDLFWGGSGCSGLEETDEIWPVYQYWRFLQPAILPPNLPRIATPSQPRVMEPVAMTALLLLLLQQPPSLTALSQGTLPSLPTLDMASRLLPLHHRGMYSFSGKLNNKWFHKKTFNFLLNDLSSFLYQLQC